MNNFAYRLALEKIDLPRAEDLIKNANLASPNKAHFMDTYGWVLFQKGEFAKAKVLYEQAYEQNPTDKIIVEHMGDVYLKEGNIEKAVEFWKKAKFFGATNRKLDLKIEKKEYYDPVY
jgi:Flp pilus assembly protein TadD